MDNLENFEQNVTEIQNTSKTQDKQSVQKPKKDWKKIVKDILYYACIVAIVCILIYMYVASRPLKSENLSCEYKDKQDKIVCTQMGDVVPEWLDLNKNMIFGSNSPYAMHLVFSKGNNNYVSMKMSDYIFIAGLNRKIIYELKDQSLEDFIRFKNFVKSSEMSNFGSVLLYCSENNLSEAACKNMKRNYRK